MPTDTFPISASANDKYVFVSAAAYPPSGTPTHQSAATSIYAQRDLSAPNYFITNAEMKWDTSSLPDNAIPSSALLRVYVVSKSNADSLSATLDWYIFNGSAADYSAAPLTTAHAGTALSAIGTSATYDFALTNLSNISVAGFTGLRMHIAQRASDAAPTGANNLIMASFDDATLVEPQLIVTYTTGGADLVGMVGV